MTRHYISPSTDQQWLRRAACRGTTHPFHPETSGRGTPSAEVRQQIAQAKAICHGCPVMGQCLQWALNDLTVQDLFSGQILGGHWWPSSWTNKEKRKHVATVRRQWEQDRDAWYAAHPELEKVA